MKVVLFEIVVLSMLGASTVMAHHSNTAYDLERVIAFEGTVVTFEWRNPHVTLGVEDDQGQMWQIETDATPVLTRSGWTGQSFAPGDPVTVRANPHKDSARAHALLLSVQGADGVPLMSLNRIETTPDRQSAASATGLSGVWLGELLPISARRRLPMVNAFVSHPLTERGEAARAAYVESMSPTNQCVRYPTPFVLAVTALYLSEFEVQEDVIYLRNEFYNTERVIYMDGREHPVDGERTNQGHSVGRWEGDVLVVDTTMFTEHRSPYGGTGIPSGINKHVVERFRLTGDRTQLTVDVFVEDPDYLAEPFTTTIAWNYSPQFEMLGLECSAEVARRFTD